MTDETTSPDFEALLDHIHASRGFDFTGYKRSSLLRRIARRRDELGAADFASYQDYLEVHPEEFALLFNTILINVTAFFRDPRAWEHLRDDVLPKLVAGASEDRPLRVWSAGCASGEEPYTLAMLLAEAMGIERVRREVKIYATDVDEEALEQARHSIYSPKAVDDVPEPYRAKYFQESNGSFAFHGDLRRAVIFGRHDLVKDAPMSRLDLLLCRNTLMYFNRETQARILGRFHFALNDSGYLFLGRAEMLLTHSNLFTPLDLRHRVFRKVAQVDFRDRVAALARPGIGMRVGEATASERLRELTFERGNVAEIVVDGEGRLAMANERARDLFGLGRHDLGRPFQDLELSYRPLELRDPLAKAADNGEPLALGLAERRLSDGTLQQFDVTVSPLIDDGQTLGTAVVFDDVTENRSLQSELERSRQELETAYEEVQSGNEELETTNEELQASNEELETTNEELQSANEELETMNEELQASNEELQSTNEQLRATSAEVQRANTYLKSILSSLNVGVAVLDQALDVRLWNPHAEELWGVRAEEAVGRPFLSLDIGLPLHEIEGFVSGTLRGKPGLENMRVHGVNRRGRPIVCRVTCDPLVADGDEILGVMVLMEDWRDATAGDPKGGVNR